ncbi:MULTISPECIES: GNAT family N-acetyltransferase [unclassified Enterococcus]|uniref:GNAT family N-acetyltransferase n=1 Tax=unclassified Enterococcus TaxID=2608891 RepID=UPI001551E4A3|nr:MULTISPECIES: GNAT family N-acetyltransferase [unclassified Enterococcus]MBS7577115.1 N-acetyltransferase [Enterococcus sp. MMGLQ5-2]MBS7584438.1 N-acetyltransferase [Enterococcus sp. MMGLQ5-1]NPD12293.1 N-acetyltransferase [Enterococcus sp. MMGLQ5-1]NPD36949.1 N-acetyltransferase [Enterococcus sp. MMGLQ5-2]
MKIRIATPKDSAALIEIYAPYVTDTAISFEYEVPSIEEFAERIENTLKKFPYLVLEENNKIIGYAYANAYNKRTAYNWACEISIYIRQDNQSHGAGTLLYLALEAILKQQHIVTIVSCITEGNQKSEAFHQKHGFEKVALFNNIGYKFGEWYHVCWMQKALTADLKNIQPFQAFKPNMLKSN